MLAITTDTLQNFLLCAEFLQAHNLTVSAVKATSAVFHWQHNPKNNIHDIQFKVPYHPAGQQYTIAFTSDINHISLTFPQLVCSGVQRFTRGGEEVVERTELHHTIRSTSQPSQSYPSHELEPNTQYSCHMTSVARKLESGPSAWVNFTTSPGSKRSTGECFIIGVIGQNDLCKYLVSQ